jgi:hypothetical protein
MLLRIWLFFHSRQGESSRRSRLVQLFVSPFIVGKFSTFFSPHLPSLLQWDCCCGGRTIAWTVTTDFPLFQRPKLPCCVYIHTYMPSWGYEADRVLLVSLTVTPSKVFSGYLCLYAFRSVGSPSVGTEEEVFLWKHIVGNIGLKHFGYSSAVGAKPKQLQECSEKARWGSIECSEAWTSSGSGKVASCPPGYPTHSEWWEGWWWDRISKSATRWW